MKELEFTTVEQTDSLYEKASFSLSEKYKGAWDDEVHNSFHHLLFQINENHSRIHSGVIDAKEIYHTAVGLKVEELCQAANNLCREVDSL